MHKIYEKRNESDPCYFLSGNQFGNFIRKNRFEIFTILPKLGIDLLTRFAQFVLRTDTYMETNLEVYQSIRSFILRKGMKTEKVRISEKHTELLTENGFFIRTVRDPPNYFAVKFEKRGGKDGFMHYDGLQDYVEENTRVEALSFDRLDYLFRVYLSLLMVPLFLKLAHYYVVPTIVRLVQNLFFRIASFS